MDPHYVEWVLVKGFDLSYHNKYHTKETILFTVNPHYEEPQRTTNSSIPTLPESPTPLGLGSRV